MMGLELYALSLGAADVRRFDPESGAFLGTLLSAEKDGIKSPDGMAIDRDGNLYISGYHSDNILAYDGNGNFLRTISDNIRRPTTGAIDAEGMLLIGGFGEEGESEGTDGRDDMAERCKGPCACKIVRFDPRDGRYLGVFAQGGGLNGPDGVHFGPDGHVYVSSFRGDQILRYHGVTGAFIDVFAEHAELDGASGLTFGPDGRLYVCSWYKAQLLCFDGDSGAYLGPFGSGTMQWPNRLAFAPDNTLYVASLATSSIMRYALTGELIGKLADIPQPTDLVFVIRKGGVGLPLI